ncbi:MAG: hypothetical protein Q4Q27_06855 [Methanosarcina mazei]|nr:hypothetical protein [Methanosarcina mazei]MDO5839834.1 hypothetical protein [Methanosarcina mazei]
MLEHIKNPEIKKKILRPKKAKIPASLLKIVKFVKLSICAKIMKIIAIDLKASIS